MKRILILGVNGFIGHHLTRALLAEAAELYLRCADGGLLRVLESEFDGAPLAAADLRSRFGATVVPLLG